MKYLIVGLGNIGEEYRNTRHNIGFMVAEALAETEGVSFISMRYGAMAQMKYRGHILLVLKPSTYMNLSGKAVKYWLQQEKIPLEQLLVISDDKDLEFGALRMKAKGSGGTHNGLNNIIEILGSSDFPRLRFGIGHEFIAGRQIEFVLGSWSSVELLLLEERKKAAVEMIKNFMVAGINSTMNQYNNK